MESIESTDVASLLAPGQRVFVVGSSNEPVGLVDALASTPDAARGVTFVQFPLPGLNTFDFTTLHDTARMHTFFLTPDLRQSYAAGRVDYLPMQMRYVYEYLRQTKPEVALAQIAFDAHGVLRLGPNADFYGAVRESAGTVVAELNRGIVAAAGAPPISEDEIDFVVETHRDVAEMASAPIDETSATIGRIVASLIRDGDCIQTGIGAIPAAILSSLVEHNDLGLHGGLIDDGGMALIRRGVMTGKRKATDAGSHVTGMALGTRALHDWLAETPSVRFVGANVTHDIAAIGSIDQFVSINSAVEVDLEGQVNAEVVGGRQISGTGGSVDFMRGARVSRGGRSIIAMTSTARRGQSSRIVAKVEMATALRTDVDLVVTEFGVAELRHSPQAARREALIEIAHPDFREELCDA